jgi:NTP pyrophosphatase (non-canonical NTP hydrolase)
LRSEGAFKLKNANTFHDLIKKQVEFDLAHGFCLDFESNKDRYNQISRDLIGIFGEIGEFANLVKKINLQMDYKNGMSVEELGKEETALQEELVDTFIYLIRLSKLVKVDLEKAFLAKVESNARKYAKFKV